MSDLTSLQPINRTDFEVTVEEVGAARINAVPVPIRDMDDHARIVLPALPFLGWERTTGLWDDDWPEWLKRKAVGRTIYLRQKQGTLEAYEGWLDLLGADVVDVVRPPVGAFATEGQTKEQRLAFLARFAQLRITLHRAPGPGDAGTFYGSPYRAGDSNSFVGANFAVPGTADQRYGRKATIVDKGVTTEALWSKIGSAGGDVTIPVERVVIPGIARPSEPFVDQMFVGDGKLFAEPFETTSRSLTLGVDRSPTSLVKLPLVSREATPLEVVSVTPERVSETTLMADRPMLVDGFVGGFAYMNTAPDRYYDRFYIFDRSRSPSVSSDSYGTFVGHSYAEITPFSAELRVHYPGSAAGMDAYAGGFVGAFPAPSSGRLEKIANAVRASKAARDKIYFTAQTKRKRTLEDGIPLDGTYGFGDLIEIARGSA